jgi:tetratricopeptide (TPR) repeat protein
MHDYRNAADALKRALDLQPENTRLQAGLANNLMLSDRVEEALSIFEKLSAEDPTNMHPKLRIAEIHRVKRNYVKAAEALKKAKALNPQDMEVRYEVRLLEAQSKYAEAIAL